VARQEQVVEVLGVAGRDDIDAFRAFVEEHGLDGVTHIADLDGAIWQRFEVPAQPAWVFIEGASGAVDRHFGALDPDELAQRLQALGG
jgi:hypothetical protein